METTPNLRGHHLICLHFFCGEGYSPDFAEHLGSILERAENRGIEVCSGPDDVCRRCPHLSGERCRYNEQAEEEIRQMDQLALELLGLSTGMVTEWSTIRQTIPSVFIAWYAACCADCDWRWACEGKRLYQELRRGSKIT
jgi:uncharacterized protein